MTGGYGEAVRSRSAIEEADGKKGVYYPISSGTRYEMLVAEERRIERVRHRELEGPEAHDRLGKRRHTG